MRESQDVGEVKEKSKARAGRTETRSATHWSRRERYMMEWADGRDDIEARGLGRPHEWSDADTLSSQPEEMEDKRIEARTGNE